MATNGTKVSVRYIMGSECNEVYGYTFWTFRILLSIKVHASVKLGSIIGRNCSWSDLKVLTLCRDEGNVSPGGGEGDMSPDNARVTVG